MTELVKGFGILAGYFIVCASAALLFIAVVYPILSVAERWSGYSALLTERRGGEIKNRLFPVFTMFAILNALCRGPRGFESEH